MLQGRAIVHNGTDYKMAIPYVYNSNKWTHAIAYVYDGSWKKSCQAGTIMVYWLDSDGKYMVDSDGKNILVRAQ